MTAVKEIKTVSLGNGNQVTYKIVESGTAYHKETPSEVVSWLETARERGQRIRIFYGDADTGRDWLEEYDTIGRVGRSTGNIKVPLLIPNSRSMGGGAILDHCIVRITVDKREVYRHPKYHTGAFQIRNYVGNEYPYQVWRVFGTGSSNVASFKTQQQAERWIDFIKGDRNRK